MTEVQMRVFFLFSSLTSRWRIVCPAIIKNFIQNRRPSK